MPLHSSYGLNVILPTTRQTGGDQFLPENALGVHFWRAALIASAYLKKNPTTFSFYNMLAAFLFKEL